MADQIEAIIALTNQSNYANPKQMGFIRTGEFGGLHTYEGRSMPLKEFNERSDKIIDEAITWGLFPHVRLVKVSEAPPVKKKSTPTICWARTTPTL